jgi:DNA polymerase sigma
MSFETNIYLYLSPSDERIFKKNSISDEIQNILTDISTGGVLANLFGSTMTKLAHLK